MKKFFWSIIVIVGLLFTFVGCEKLPETGRVGDYKGEFMGLRLENEDSENPIVITRFEFTNYSGSPISFQKALSPTLKQKGSELIPVEQEINTDNVEVAPGDTHSIDMKYYLISKDELVDITITNHITGESYTVQSHCEK